MIIRRYARFVKRGKEEKREEGKEERKEERNVEGRKEGAWCACWIEGETRDRCARRRGGLGCCWRGAVCKWG